jgi:hypothetical protein
MFWQDFRLWQLMFQMDLSRIPHSLARLSEEAACLVSGSIQRRLIEEQIARLRATMLPESQTGDRTHGRSAGLVAEGDSLWR